MTHQERLDAFCHQVNRRLSEYFDGVNPLLYDAMRYSLLAGGKRIRPALVLEFCRISGGGDALDFACAVELIHTYSLIHDDLPCMDNDDFRRGKPTSHKIYGEAIALLAGDALLTEAFSLIAGAPVEDLKKVKALAELSTAAGAYGMVGGQVLDMEGQLRPMQVNEVVQMHRQKTGALIAAAACIGCIAGGGTDNQIESARQYANHLGLAFQIRDDMLDTSGDPEKMGKSVHSDNNKSTFISLYGYEECKHMVLAETRRAKESLESFSDNSFLIWLADFLCDREK